MNSSERNSFDTGRMPGNRMSGNKMSDDMPLSSLSLGMAYVPWQKSFDNLYDTDKAFCVGTIFPCLDKPFLGRGGCK